VTSAASESSDEDRGEETSGSDGSSNDSGSDASTEASSADEPGSSTRGDAETSTSEIGTETSSGTTSGGDEATGEADETSVEASESSGGDSTTGDPGDGGPVCLGLTNGSGTTIPCATTAEGAAVCFSSSTPTPLTYDDGAPVEGVAAVSGEGFTEAACVVLQSGAVHCGRHDTISRTPVIAAGATVVSGSLTSSCAVVDREVSCWDSGNASTVRTLDLGGAHPVQLACYYHGCCVVTDAAEILCWGENNTGMHGTGDTAEHTAPTAIAAPPGAALQVGPGQDHMCGVFEGGLVQCWGEDWNAQLGGLGASRDVGVELVTEGARAVVGGQFHTCVLFEDGTVQCSSTGQSEGAGLDQGGLAPVEGISTAVALTAGKHYTCARLEDATVACWGSVSGSSTPTTIEGLTTRSCGG